MTQDTFRHPASYRDPAGFVFLREGIIYRQVNKTFKDHFDYLHSSGCYDELVTKKLLIPHVLTGEHGDSEEAYAVIRPAQLDFVSYPYEWSFHMLKDAALLTLAIAKLALAHGMILKDASPFNVQWHEGKLMFIDTLSFEKFTDTPWVAYRQFCENFIGPLLLMHYNRQPLHHLHLAWPEGIPLAVTRSMLPRKSKLNLHTYLHIHLHARYQGHENKKTKTIQPFTRQKLSNLLSSLETLVKKCDLPESDSTWLNYYDDASSREDYLPRKKLLVNQWLDEYAGISTGIDLGANEGEFSQMMAAKGIRTVAADFDPYCIDRLYQRITVEQIKDLQPLVMDLATPSPANGVNYSERSNFSERCGRDIVLALALVHHLAIGRNIRLADIVRFLAPIGSLLIIEFVPATDPLVVKMMALKNHPFSDYTQDKFEQEFLVKYILINKAAISTSGRTLYLFKRR